MINTYRILYALGITPWEEMPKLPIADQVRAMFDREEAGREPPYGRVLDLGCGSGTWAIELQKRGWQVTGVDVVNKALRQAQTRAGEAGADVRFVKADITALDKNLVGNGYSLVVDFGTVHGMKPDLCKDVGRCVNELTTDDATMLMLAFEPKKRTPLPRGMSPQEILETYPGWTIIDAMEQDLRDAPKVIAKANPRWYRLVKNGGNRRKDQ